LSVELREAAEFRDYSSLALWGFYWCMFQYKSPEHKYVRVCCFGLVFLFLIICMDHGSCSSRNVSLTIHI